MTSSRKTILLRFLRSLAALIVASTAAWVVGPDALSLVPAGYQFIVTGVLAPALLALEKWIRDGGDANS